MKQQIRPVVKIQLQDNLEIPKPATPASAGLDLKANVYQITSLYPGETKIIPTGIKLAMPENIALFILPRSGKALNHLEIANSPGLVDSDYRDELGIIVHNSGENLITILPGERIAQMFFIPVIRVDFEQVEELDETDRKGGFGHTGS